MSLLKMFLNKQELFVKNTFPTEVCFDMYRSQHNTFQIDLFFVIVVRVCFQFF